MYTPLRNARIKKGLTLDKLAAMVGSGKGNLSRIERGVQTPRSVLAARLCAVFPGELSELQLIYPERYKPK